MKEQLILSMLSLASEQGLGNVSLSRLANENGISKATIFHHFTGRAHLIEEVFTYCHRLALKRMRTIDLEGNAEEVLLRALDHWSELYETEPLYSFYRIVEQESWTNGQARTIKQTFDEMLIAQSSVLIEHLEERGKLRIDDLELAIETFSATIARHLVRTLLTDEEIRYQAERFIRRFCTHYAPT
ncbi:MAG: transcriptional regulator BetI [Spirochaetes bacterium ADurb.Bin315]|nr:TetR/AcrR family transcriptional regulator [Spirochaetota bacterium]OQA45186.1 MAG: transcriptional regulator BetI [Spirochaetes bacterium ADurb.Bin315]